MIQVRMTSISNRLKDAGYDYEEEHKIYSELLTDVYNNPRWYLDSLEYLPEFRLSFIRYSNQKIYKDNATTNRDERPVEGTTEL